MGTASSVSGDMDMVSLEATVRWMPLDKESGDFSLKLSKSGLFPGDERSLICKDGIVLCVAEVYRLVG